MNLRFALAVAILALACSTARAWPACPGNWDVVPTGTQSTASSGYGAVVTEGGVTYQCTNPTPTSKNTNSTSNSASNSNSTSNSNSNSISASNSDSSSKSSSSASQKQKQNQNQTQTANGGNATAGASNNSSGNTTSYTSVENQVRQTPVAYAPDAAFTTSPCVKGFSGGLGLPGGSGTLGISKTDKGCDSRQTAVVFHALGNDTAAAKVLCSTDAAKRAKLTPTDCAAIAPPPIAIPAPVLVPTETPAPVVIIVPAPVPPIAITDILPPPPKFRPVYRMHDFGDCHIDTRPSNVCYRELDNAILALSQDTSTKIVLTGPVETAKMVPYLQKRVSAARIELHLTDEANSTLTIQTAEPEREE